MGQAGGDRLIGSAAHSAQPLTELPVWAVLVRAPNPGPMTLDGTNTWVLRPPASDEVIVVDPGPLDEGHLAAVVAAGRVVTVIATHAHPDHVEGMRRLLELCPAARTWAADGDDDMYATADGLSVRSIATPGHTADSVSLVVEWSGQRAVLTGDTILGRGTTVVAHPDGDLGDYLASLDRLERLGRLPVLPGHGPALADCGAAARVYREHRLARLDQVRRARAAGADTAAEVVARVYGDTPAELHWAAELSVLAQLAYLARESGTGPVRLDTP